MKFLVILSVILFCAPVYAEKVIKVYDGDTITLLSNERIRLMCIDAPELKPNSHGPANKPEAIKSRDFLRTLILNKEVKISRYGKDLYGRTLGRVYLTNGQEVNEILFREGLAVKYMSSKCSWAK